jgi:hypothetical protein
LPREIVVVRHGSPRSRRLVMVRDHFAVFEREAPLDELLAQADVDED